LSSRTAAATAPAEPTATADLVRGAYLVERVALCLTCHSQRDWTAYSGPIVPGSEAAGGIVGVFGSADLAPPITAAALSSTPSADLAAQLRDPQTPLHSDPGLSGLQDLTAADAEAVIAYLGNGRPPTALGELSVSGAPPWSERGTAEAGRYLAAIGRCSQCHGQDFGGGLEIELPTGSSLPSANLTSDPAGSVWRMARDEFIANFKSLDSPDLAYLPVPEGEINTAMPWPWLAGMAEAVLGALYDYLRTVTPVASPPAAAPE
jgi:cytochrome c553